MPLWRSAGALPRPGRQTGRAQSQAPGRRTERPTRDARLPLGCAPQAHGPAARTVLAFLSTLPPPRLFPIHVSSPPLHPPRFSTAPETLQVQHGSHAETGCEPPPCPLPPSKTTPATRPGHLRRQRGPLPPTRKNSDRGGYRHGGRGVRALAKGTVARCAYTRAGLPPVAVPLPLRPSPPRLQPTGATAHLGAG